MKPIPFLSLAPQHAQTRAEVLEAITSVYDKNWFVLGKELEAFEQEYAGFSSTPFCIGVGNGLDALFIALKACGVGPGDEVIIPAHTFLATWLAVVRTGAKVVPVEVDPATYNIDPKQVEEALTKNTKAIVPVHLYGQPCDMTSLMSITRQRGIIVIEDNAQAHGATWDGKITGSFGDCSATSFYPVKNLGALGDGGAIVTRNYEFAQFAYRYRNYGFETKNISEEQGINSRLDEVQAAVLRIKLKHLHRWNNDRIRLASLYMKNLTGVGDLQLPSSSPQARHVYHLFVIRTSKRDALKEYLTVRHIETAVHYPVPPHLQKSFQDLGYQKGAFALTEAIAQTTLSLPLWPGMEEAQVDYVCETVKNFFR